MKKTFIIVLIAFGFWKVFLSNSVVEYGPGVMAPDIPKQETISDNLPFAFNEYSVTPLANFELKAKVLGKEIYRFDDGSDLSSTDLALGWGRMSDESIIEQLDITQSGRWYRWRSKGSNYPIPRREIEKSSANMHLIPKDSSIESQFDKVRLGDIVSIKGMLVRVDRADGWHWDTSLTRDDIGGGACELIFVESLDIEEY